MQTQHIALVPEAADFDLSELVRVSAALQKQVTCDLAPIWKISATVDPFTRLENVPVGYLPILVTRGELGSQAGIHVDKHGYPYAQIGWSRDWSLAASRTCLELLVNPYEQRTVTRPRRGSTRAPSSSSSSLARRASMRATRTWSTTYRCPTSRRRSSSAAHGGCSATAT